MGLDQLTRDALELIAAERIEQDEKWGQQNHPFHWIGYDDETQEWNERQERNFKDLVDELAEQGVLSWDYVLLEEVFEALSAKTPEEQEKELIQVAAVASAAWEASRRRRGLL